MLKIKNETGKVVAILKDDASEPEVQEEKECSCKECKCEEKECEEEEGEKE